jgi:hypothetical protein
MQASSFQLWKSLVAASLGSLMLAGACPGGSAEGNAAARATASSRGRCDATLVHYRPYKGVQAGLEQLPWIAASPVSSGLVGHLFYYDRLNVWKQKRLPRVRMYRGGQSPDGRLSMKILWEVRRGSALLLEVRARRLDGSGGFTSGCRRRARTRSSSRPSSTCPQQAAGV